MTRSMDDFVSRMERRRKIRKHIESRVDMDEIRRAKKKEAEDNRRYMRDNRFRPGFWS